MTNKMSEALAIDYSEEMSTAAKQVSYSTKQSNKVIPPSLRQCTLKRSISFQGIAKQNKNCIKVTLRPAPANKGIVFRRIDLNPVCIIPATIEWVVADTIQINLVKNNIYIKGIEHLLSAFSGLGIDNAYIDINGDELPMFDGSACQFVFLIESAGIAMQSERKNFIRIKDTVKITKGNASASIEPYEGLRVNCTIDDHHKSFMQKQYAVELSSRAYIKEIVRARHHAASLEKHDLRYEDELLRHLVMDVMGHLYTLGCQIIGSIKIHQTDTVLDYPLIQRLLKQSHAWEYVTFTHGKYSTQYEPLMINSVT